MTGHLPIAEFNAFHVSGILLAAWAVIVTAIGITRPGFPGSAAAARGTAAISIVLVLATISLAIYEGTKEEEGGEGEAAAEPAPEPAAGGGATLQLAADPGGALRFDKSSLTADAGSVTIDMKNDSEIPHDVAIEGNGVDEKGKDVTGGGTSTVTADLEPGQYTFYCAVPGHKQAGMEGTLTVR
ncbi:MAG: cupredoxin domain-containing protein [Thermoleophilaceae bacterium]|nr:cupredoxin domain-containing protein [Thermoleophilaceae bacterium]